MSNLPIILFESYPYFSGNPFEIFKGLLSRGYGNKYCMLWAVASNDMKKYRFPTIPFFGAPSDYINAILHQTQLIIDSNRFIHKIPGVFRIHTRHGCSFKQCKSYYNGIGEADAIITTSDDMKKIDEVSWPSYCRDKFIITGLPSNDTLFHPEYKNTHSLLRELLCPDSVDNIITWLPTYRQHRLGNGTVNHKYPFGLPLINHLNDFENLNQYLVSRNVLLLIQMHHAQSHNYKQLPNFSNIKFITQSIKDKYNVSTSDILGSSNALITDYSSAYHEYIILNRPIALTIDDFDEYSRNVGFLYDYHEWISGHRCGRMNDLYQFIDNLTIGHDMYAEQRNVSLHKIHKFIDDQSTNRVLNYLENNKFISKE